MTNTTNDPADESPLTTPNRTGAAVRAGIVLAATVAAALVKVIAGGHPQVDQNGAVQDVTLVQVIVTSLLAGLAGWGFLAGLERNVSRPRLVWTVVALVVGVLSLGGPLGAAVDRHTAVTLIAMHVVIVAILVPGLALVARPRPKRESA